MPATRFHSISGMRARMSAGMFFAASPMTSKLRHASTMSSRNTSGSRCTDGLAKNPIAKTRFQSALHHEIDLACEKRFEELFDAHVVVERLPAEVHQDG